MYTSSNVYIFIAMTVYIASMNLRGSRAKAPDGCKSVNVTSAQAKNSIDRLSFSPMTPVSGGYRGYWCFENYWQAGKVYSGVNHEKSKEWMKSQTVPRRRYPGGKGKTVLCSLWDYAGIENAEMDYVLSRKYIYVPEYIALTEKVGETRLSQLRELLKSTDIVIYDFDGPRDSERNPICESVDVHMLRRHINDPNLSFGHGYIVAAMLLGIKPEEYCD